MVVGSGTVPGSLDTGYLGTGFLGTGFLGTGCLGTDSGIVLDCRVEDTDPGGTVPGLRETAHDLDNILDLDMPEGIDLGDIGLAGVVPGSETAPDSDIGLG